MSQAASVKPLAEEAETLAPYWRWEVGSSTTVTIPHIILLLGFQHIHKFLNDTWQSRYQTKLSSSMLTLLWSTIASIFSLGGFFGAHLGGIMAGWLGR